jgi:hypothetical protein
MVNAGFPKPSRYGFEMVHAPAVRFFGANRRQLKIYSESNRWFFSRIFA